MTTPTTAIGIQRRQLGNELRKLREVAGLTQEQAAEHLGKAANKISRVENGKVGISKTDLDALLGRYQAPAKDALWCRELAQGARRRRTRASAETTLYLGPKWFRAFRDLEQSASQTMQVGPEIVPGNLQTESYTRAMVSGRGSYPDHQTVEDIVRAPHIRKLRDARGVLVWDDLSLLCFTPAMRRRTIFVFHHHDPLHYDSAPVEPLLWRALFAALRECAAVVCVSPYWAEQLAAHGIPAHVVYNAFDLPTLDTIRAENRDEMRRRFGLPNDRTLVYVGKAVHGKGIEHAHSVLGEHPDLYLVSTGNNTIGARTHHTGWLPYLDHLRAVRACHVGLFLSTLHEGWSRCAAEAILLDLPCVTSGIAGLGDLARLTDQPIADLPQLAEQLHTRARTPASVTTEARQRLAAFDIPYFTSAWRYLLLNAMRNLDEPPQPLADLRQARDGQPRLLT